MTLLYQGGNLMSALAKPSTGNRYQAVSEAKAGGANYTPKHLSDFVASQLVRAAGVTHPNANLRVLDPAVGDGELLVSLLEHLTVEHHAGIEIVGFDTSEIALAAANERLKQKFPHVRVNLVLGNFLDFASSFFSSEVNGDLFQKETPAAFDLIIANPPYVRTQIMGAEQAQLMARQFGLAGRVDLYHAFLIGMAWVLKRGGIAAIIVSNRFMSTKSGAPVRRAILESFNVLHAWDMGDTKLFEAAVLPAILLLEKAGANKCVENIAPPFTCIYTTHEPATTHANDPIMALQNSGVVSVQDGRRFMVRHGILDNGGKLEGIWRPSSNSTDDWLATVTAHTWKVFGDIGKIRVGVKTTADKVFIRSDWDELPASQQPELLRPLTTHQGARRFKGVAASKPQQIVYPHHVIQSVRRAIDLSNYPRTQAYLEQHREVLESRKYVIEAGRKWYEIWVPQDPLAWAGIKLVFRDISEQPVFWMDQSGSVVNGDCYWLISRNEADSDFLWLALAVGNSKFIEDFYDHRFHNKLYAGRRRFITQYVENFPLPDPAKNLGKGIIALAKRIYTLTPSPEADMLEKDMNKMIWEAFGLAVKEINR